MFRPPIYRQVSRWARWARELCAIPNMPAPPKAIGSVLEQKKLKRPPIEIPAFLMDGESFRRGAFERGES